MNVETTISTPPNEEYEKPIKITTGKVSKKNKRKKKDFDLDEDDDVEGEFINYYIFFRKMFKII